MNFKSPHLRAVIDGDDRHPRELAAAHGKSLPEENPNESDPFGSRMDKSISFNPIVGALEFPDEGAMLLCEKIKEDV